MGCEATGKVIYIRQMNAIEFHEANFFEANLFICNIVVMNIMYACCDGLYYYFFDISKFSDKCF